MTWRAISGRSYAGAGLYIDPSARIPQFSGFDRTVLAAIPVVVVAGLVGGDEDDDGGGGGGGGGGAGGGGGRGLHSFRFHLNLSSSVHRVTQLNDEYVLELLKLRV